MASGNTLMQWIIIPEETGVVKEGGGGKGTRGLGGNGGEGESQAGGRGWDGLPKAIMGKLTFWSTQLSGYTQSVPGAAQFLSKYL